MKLLTAHQIRELDRVTIEEIGVPGPVLMETAGRAVVSSLVQRYQALAPGPVIVFAGKGNNGGDGFVIARVLRDRGWDVQVVVLAAAKEITGDARIHLRALKRSGGDVLHVHDEYRLQRVLEKLSSPALIVDALLGTGLSCDVRGIYRQAISWGKDQPVPIVAVDIPSGVDADNGRILGSAMIADLTVTFAAAKPGLVSLPGAACCGEVVVSDIGIPKSLLDDQSPQGEYLEHHIARTLLPVRPSEGHKGSFGHLLVVAGSRGKTGAALLTVQGGLRSAAGLVTLALPSSLQDVFMSRLTEAMSLAVADSEGAFSSAAYEELMAAMATRDVLAMGPGIGTSETSCLLVQRLVRDCPKPVVVDADALNALVGHLETLKARSGVTPVLTPHPGEMSRLSGIPVVEIEQNRLGVAREFSRKHGVVLVLKGARTVVASPEGFYCVNSSGNPGLATGGMGDVLTGLIGGLMAQGLDPYAAASLGVYLHGLAADRLAEQFGDAGILAGDVADELPAARNALVRGDDAYDDC